MNKESSIQLLIRKIKSSIASTKFSEDPLILGLAILLMLLLLLYTFGAFAPQEEMWHRSYGGAGSDVGNSVLEVKDGGYVIAGTTSSYGAGRDDAWLVEADQNGNEKWNRTFGGSDDDSGVSVMQINDGSCIFAGATSSFGAGDFDAWLIKTNSDGKERWNKTYGGASYDWGYSVQEIKDGGYIIAGETRSYGAGGSDVWLIKADVSGDEEWNRTFGGPKDDGGRAVQRTRDDGYVIAGFTESYGTGGKDVWLIKTDSAGNEQWNITFGGSRDDRGELVQQVKDGGYIIAGGANAPLANKSLTGDAWLIRTDSNGIMQWGKIFSFGNSNYDLATAAQETADGGYILAGYGLGTGMYSWLIKTDNVGMKQWDKVFDESGRNEGSSVQQAGDGSYVSTGWTTSSGNVDAWLMKIAARMQS